MKTTLYIFLFFCPVLLTGCFGDEQGEQKSDPSADTTAQDPKPRYPGMDADMTHYSADSQVMMNGEKYLLRWTARLDTFARYHFTDDSEHVRENKKENPSGYNARYNFLLTDEDGSVVFSTDMTKRDFRDIFDGEILTKSNAELPVFRGYLNRFDAFVFTVRFWIPDTDIGEESILLINRKGEITEISINNYFGGSGCDGDIAVSSNGRLILTNRKILHADGRKISIDKTDLLQVATRLVNDSCILVIRERNGSNRNNGILMNADGQMLLQFPYKGYYEELGYIIPIFSDTITRSMYLLDTTSKNIRIIHQDHPLKSRVVPYSEMKTTNKHAVTNQVFLDFNISGSESRFYVDPTSGRISRVVLK